MPFSELLSRSVQTLHDWGNTSSSSIWYETDWIERFGVSWQRGGWGPDGVGLCFESLVLKMRLTLQIPGSRFQSRMVLQFLKSQVSLCYCIGIRYHSVALCFCTDIETIWIDLVSIESGLSMCQGPSERGAGSPNFIRKWFQVQFGRAFAASDASERSAKTMTLGRLYINIYIYNVNPGLISHCLLIRGVLLQG